MAGKTMKWAFVRKNREHQKFSFWQWSRYFWHFGIHFWRITGVGKSKKPINRAFVRKLGKCPKFCFWKYSRHFWHSGRNFWQITDVRIVEKFIKWTFVSEFIKCQKFQMGKNIFGGMHLWNSWKGMDFGMVNHLLRRCNRLQDIKKEKSMGGCNGMEDISLVRRRALRRNSAMAGCILPFFSYHRAVLGHNIRKNHVAVRQDGTKGLYAMSHNMAWMGLAKA